MNSRKQRNALNQIERRLADYFYKCFWLATAWPKTSLLLSLLLVFCTAPFMLQLEVVDNVDYFEVDGSPHTGLRKELNAAFGNTEFFAIAFESPDIFSSKNLSMLRDITDKIEALESVSRVRSLTNVVDTVGTDDLFEVSKLIAEIPTSQGELSELKTRATSNPLYLKNLVSADGRTTAIVVSPIDKPEDKTLRRDLVEDVTKILSPYQARGQRFYLAGWTITNLALSHYSRKDLELLIPLCYLLVGSAVQLLFRNWRLTVLAGINISASLCSILGVFSLLGVSLNNVTIITVPLIMALALADTIHIFAHLKKETLVESESAESALAAVVRRVVVPCLFTSATTAVGFWALTVSKLAPMREFGNLAALGMAVEFIYSFLLIPPLILLLFNPEKIFTIEERQSGFRLSSVLKYCGRMSVERSREILAISAVLTIAALWTARTIRVDTNLIEYLRASTVERQSSDFIQSKLGGVSSMELSLKSDLPDGFKKLPQLQALDQLQSFVQGLDGVDLCLSFVDLLKDMNQSFHNEKVEEYRLPQSDNLVEQYLLLYEGEDLENFITPDFQHARVWVRISAHGSTELAVLIKQIESKWQGQEHAGLTLQITGDAAEIVEVVGAIVDGQIASIFWATILIAAMLTVAFRSLSLGLLSLIPNLIPIIFNFALMAILDIPLNTGTALITAVALGIAVDDTTHFLNEYRVLRQKGTDIRSSIETTMVEKGPAIIATSVILTIGFAVLTCGTFVPTIHFGILTGIIMLVAPIGDLIVLPALLACRNKN